MRLKLEHSFDRVALVTFVYAGKGDDCDADDDNDGHVSRWLLLRLTHYPNLKRATETSGCPAISIHTDDTNTRSPRMPVVPT